MSHVELKRDRIDGLGVLVVARIVGSMRRWVLVALIIGAAVFLGSYALARPDPKGSAARIPTGGQQLASELAVLRRAQTPADRSFLSILRRVTQRYPVAPTSGRLAKRLRGYVPSLTRLVQTLPDGRKVFLLVKHQAASYTAGLVFLQPNGAVGKGGPSIAGGAGGQPAAAMHDLNPGSCFGYTDYDIVPDGIARVRFIFARQDELGFVYRRVLTVDVPVHNNAAIATVTARTPCETPNVVNWYAANGRVIASYGTASGLNRITRPIRHGPPWGP